MVGKTALNKERYHLNGGPFQTLAKTCQNETDRIVYEYDIIYQKVGVNYGYKCKKYHCQCLT